MPNYRLYQLDGAGQISTAEWIDAGDDDEARRKAQDLVSAARYELWQRDRLVEGPGTQGK